MRYGVIGAGVLGLAVGLRLAQRGHEVVILERDHVPGGLASSFEVEPGIWLERFYHHLFRSDRAAISLIREVGLGDALQWFRPTTTILVGDRPHPLDSAGALLRFDAIAIRDRLRMAAAIAVIKLLPSPRPLESSTADRWMRRVGGARGHEAIWQPLLSAKFGEAAGHVSMAWLWARIHDRTRDLGYVSGGFHRFYTALSAAVEQHGAELRYATPVAAIETVPKGVMLRPAPGSVESPMVFDRVVSTLPAALTTRLIGDPVAPSLAPRLLQPLSAHCVVLALDRPLTGIYWIGIGDRRSPFLAVVEHTAMLGSAAYGGHHLVYLGAYRTPDDPLPTLPVSEQLAAAAKLLRTLNPSFDEGWIRSVWTFAAPFAQPIVDVGYRRRIPGFATRVPGLYSANMFQVYPHDRGQNYSIVLAERLVRYLERPGAAADYLS